MLLCTQSRLETPHRQGCEQSHEGLLEVSWGSADTLELPGLLLQSRILFPVLVLLCLSGLEWTLPFYTTPPPGTKSDASLRWHPPKHSCTQRDQGTGKVNKMVVLRLCCSLWRSTSSNSWNCDFIVLGYGLGLGMFKSTLPHNPGKNENITQEDIYFQLCQS